MSDEIPGRIAQVIEGLERKSVYAVVECSSSGAEGHTQETHVVRLDSQTLEKKAMLQLEKGAYGKIELLPDGATMLLMDGRLKLIATETMAETEATKPGKVPSDQ